MSAELSEAENTHSIESADSDLVRDRPGSLWIVWIILVPLVYVLSIGPAARLVAMPNINPDYLVVIYRPLGLVADNCPPLKSVLRWYIDLWKS